MADKIGYAGALDTTSAPIPLKYTDNGDGTYSAAGGAGGAGSATITAPLGRKADAASVSTAFSTEDVALLTQRASTATVTSVNDTASSTQLLAATTARVGFRVFNDSASILYVKFGTTASTTDYTVRIDPYGYLEENYYTGRVDGIWSADASGAARITEL